MQQTKSGMGCTLGSWALAAGAGLLVFVLLLVLGGWGFIGAVFAAGAVFVVLGLVFGWMFCRELPPARGPGNIDTPAAPSAASSALKSATPAPTPTAPKADATPAPVASAASPAPETLVAAHADGGKPSTLAAARDGGPDNLKEIKGVGPKLEKLLNEMGFFHFDQIATWSDENVAWVNDNLEGVRGRVSRDNWVEQAKILAAGGDTAFSKRVDKGDVY